MSTYTVYVLTPQMTLQNVEADNETAAKHEVRKLWNRELEVLLQDKGVVRLEAVPVDAAAATEQPAYLAAVGWTDADTRQASARGWMLFDSERGPEIQAIDEPDAAAGEASYPGTEPELVAEVKGRAQDGDPTAIKALAVERRFAPASAKLDGIDGPEWAWVERR